MSTTEAQALTTDLEGLRARLTAFQRDSGQDVGEALAFVQAAVLALSEAVPAARVYRATATPDGDGYAVAVTGSHGQDVFTTRTVGAVFDQRSLVFELAREGWSVSGWKAEAGTWTATATARPKLRQGQPLWSGPRRVGTRGER